MLKMLHKTLTYDADTLVVGAKKTQHLATQLESDEFDLLMKKMRSDAEVAAVYERKVADQEAKAYYDRLKENG